MAHFFTDIDKRMAGLPNTYLSLILVGIAIVCIAIATFGTPSLKAVTAAWFIFP